MIPLGSSVWRDYETSGVPASGVYSPEKREIRTWAEYLESLLNAGPGASLVYTSKTAIDADLAHGANTAAIVVGDATPANNGLYVKIGASASGSWSRIGDLPTALVRLTVSGGTADAIQATSTEEPLVPGDKLFLLVPTANNTGAVTLARNGGTAYAVKSAIGSSLAAGALLNSIPVLMIWVTDHYRLLISTPVDETGLLADATAAADAAEGYKDLAEGAAAALGNQVHQYDTRAQAAAASIPSGVSEIKITRYASGHPIAYATYIQGDSSGPLAFQDADGDWWELDITGENILAAWFGVKADGTNDDASAINAALVAADGKPVILPPGTINVGSKLERTTSTSTTFKSGPILRGAGMNVTTLSYSGATTDVGVISLTTGDTSGLKYMLGAEISDLQITQANTTADVDAIRMTATWMLTIRRVQIQNMKRHGIFVPPRTDIHTNSDHYQDLYPMIEHCRINGCGGWGIRFEAGNGAGPHFIARNQITSCVGGGIYTEVGQGTIENNVITGCGTAAGDAALTGGMIVAAAAVVDSGPTPYGLRIIHNEFDTNYMVNLRISAGVCCLVSHNRFISNLVSSAMTPAEHIILGRSAVTTCTSSTFVNNAHRAPTGSALAVYCYDKQNGGYIEVREPLYIGLGSGAVKYFGLTYAAGDRVYEALSQVLTP
jgi:hypothetical protein